MNIQRVVSMVAVVLAVCGLCPAAGGQNETAGTTKVFTRISSVFQTEVEALGKRVKEKGREKVVYVGEFINAEGRSATARVIVQLPGMARLQGFKDKDLVFDGERAKNATRSIDIALLESLLMDTQEGMLSLIQSGASVRLLGRDFGPDPQQNPDYAGPRSDIYDVMAPDLFRKNAPFQSRLYTFDSKTKLLQSTQYSDRSVSPPVRIETRFSMWGTIDGSAFPACIERYEDGKLVFTFVATSIESGPAEDVTNYR